MTAQNLNCYQARWSLYLSCFDIQFVHRAGKKSGKPDALLGQVDHKKGESNNQDQVFLPPDHFLAAHAIGDVVLEELDKGLMYWVK